MPAVNCPACGAGTRIPLERIGQKIECSKCQGSFVAEAEPESWTRFLHHRHVAGLRAGIVLLVLAVIAAAIVASALPNYPTMYHAIFGRDAPPIERYAFWTFILGGIAGVGLIVRWSRAQQRWRKR